MVGSARPGDQVSVPILLFGAAHGRGDLLWMRKEENAMGLREGFSFKFD